MPNTEEKIKKLKHNNNNENAKIHIFSLKNEKDKKEIDRLITEKEITRIVDDYDEQAYELDLVKNPKKIGTKKAEKKYKLTDGKWIYYPWRKTLVHVLDENSYNKLRASRNHNLITEIEQEKFRKSRIGIAGLNVGNPAAICIALESGANEMKFADFDPLSLTNLNRFRASITELGINKVILSARQTYEINPYAKLELFEQGITPENIEQFLLKPRIDVLVEEMDNLPLKIRIRELARKNKIPVVMVTGNGENVIIDVERFDKNPKLPLLNGHLKQSIIEKSNPEILKNLPLKEKVLVARDFMGAKFLTKRLQESFLLIGSKLAGIPQIAESSFLRGAAVCYVVRQIITNKPMPSGRYSLKLDSMLKNK